MVKNIYIGARNDFFVLSKGISASVAVGFLCVTMTQIKKTI